MIRTVINLIHVIIHEIRKEIVVMRRNITGFFLKKTGFGMGGGEVYLPLQKINNFCKCVIFKEKARQTDKRVTNQ